MPSSDEVAPQDYYGDTLSLAPGWKAGGWTRWGLTDPMPRICSVCGTEADPLLTFATTEWDSGGSWLPEEDRAHPPHRLSPALPPGNSTEVEVASGYDPQLHVCPTSQDQPHIELIQ
ncbi:hypothetical protein ACIO8G_02000 [Streptomyces sp. NPDC087219]|uniref:hypothetical protein n=1 Tax=Streptomyces sp. NPDC087219 TaxID=3365770 RepID=UPI0038074CAC